MKRALFFLLVASACNDARPDAVGRDQKRVDDLGSKARAVLDAPLVPTDATVDGVPIRIGLPDGYVPFELGGEADEGRWQWGPKELGVTMPTLSVEVRRASQLPETLDGARASFGDDLIRAGEAPGGFFAAYRRTEPAISGYTRWIANGDGSLECSGNLIDEQTMTDEEAIALIERACLSLEAR